METRIVAFQGESMMDLSRQIDDWLDGRRKQRHEIGPTWVKQVSLASKTHALDGASLTSTWGALLTVSVAIDRPLP